MALSTRDGGETTKLMVKVGSSMQTETSTTVFGKMTRPTVSVFTVISMGPATRATGKRTSNMVRG